MRSRSVLGIAWLLAACGGKVEPSAADGVGAGVGPMEGEGAQPADACDLSLPKTRAEYLPPSSCSAIGTGTVGPATSESELLDRVVGEWLLCSSLSAFGTDDEIGLELAADGNWYKLYPDGGGGVTRGSGLDQQGTFAAIDLGDSMQLNLSIESGTWHFVPEFAEVPRKLRLVNIGVIGDYVKNDAAGRCVVPHDPPSGNYAPPEACASEPTPLPTPDAIESARELITGRWLTCGGSFFGTEDDVGLEVLADGTFHKLYASGDDVVRGEGVGREGTYELFDYGGINLTAAGEGTMFVTSLILGQDPRTLKLDTIGRYQGFYVFDEASAP